MIRFRLLLISFFCCSFFAANAAQSGVLKGNVRDENNMPIPDALVRILTTTLGSLTDEKGDFRFAEIAEGSYQVEVKAMGYLPVERK